MRPKKNMIQLAAKHLEKILYQDFLLWKIHKNHKKISQEQILRQICLISQLIVNKKNHHILMENRFAKTLISVAIYLRLNTEVLEQDL